MADMMSILSSAYKTAGQSAAIPSQTKYVAVDPTLYQGTWSGTYANKKAFTISVSDISGFRAQVRYRSAGTVKNQSVLIKDGSFRIGDTKFLLTKRGTATIKNVVTDPANGSTFLDTAVAKQG